MRARRACRLRGRRGEAWRTFGKYDQDARVSRMTEALSACSRDVLRSLSVAYIALPLLIFLLGWTWWPWALMLGAALGSGVALVIRDGPPGGPPAREHDWRLYALIAVVLFAWLSISGIGGFGFQNHDWRFRNTVLRTLVEEPWPAVVTFDGEQRMLVSYVAYYLPAAVMGKLGQAALGSGWWLANAALWIWSFAGAGLAVAWLMRHARTYSVVPVLLLIAFCGFDVVAWWITWGDLPEITRPIGLWSQREMLLYYPGFTPQMFWVPHQALAAWIVVCLILHDGMAQRTSRNLVFFGAIALLWSPFITLGLIPYAAWVAARSRLEGLASVQNAIGLGLAAVGALFLTGVEAGKLTQGLHWSSQHLPLHTYVALFLLFLMVKFGAYAIFVRRTLLDSPEWRSTLSSLFWTTVLCLALIPLYRFGRYNDFCMRVSIPSLFVLLILIATALRPEHFRQAGRRASAVVLLLLVVVGSYSAAGELSRSISKVYGNPAIWPLGVPVASVKEFTQMAERRKLFGRQYTAPLDTRFARYLAPPLLDARSD